MTTAANEQQRLAAIVEHAAKVWPALRRFSANNPIDSYLCCMYCDRPKRMDEFEHKDDCLWLLISNAVAFADATHAAPDVDWAVSAASSPPETDDA